MYRKKPAETLLIFHQHKIKFSFAPHHNIPTTTNQVEKKISIYSISSKLNCIQSYIAYYTVIRPIIDVDMFVEI